MAIKHNSRIRLAVFDLDGTLTSVRSPFHYISTLLGYGEQANEIADRYRKGEICYKSWGKEIVLLWRGLRESQIIEIASTIPYRTGAIEFIEALKLSGVSIAIVSVAFPQHVMYRSKTLGANFVRCNTLGVEKGYLTGEFTYIVDDQNKKDIIKEIQISNGISLMETIVAGDTQGDIPMFSEAAISIAVDPETELVRESASVCLPDADWRNGMEIINRHISLD